MRPAMVMVNLKLTYETDNFNQFKCKQRPFSINKNVPR